MMESAPSTEAVYEGVYTLYNNENAAEKEKASKWLEQLQNSVFSWSIADELLQQKRDLQSCYFAAQTMRNKIQNSFHELPDDAHVSLRDSLIVHISQITNDTNPIIVTQLCLALADLALLMSSWPDPVHDLIAKLSSNPNTLWPLIVIVRLIPEEISSRHLRLGANRRDVIQKQLETNSKMVTELLVHSLGMAQGNPAKVMKIIKCFTSWISIQAIDVSDASNNVVVGESFKLLLSQETEIKLHDAAADLLSALLQCLECCNQPMLEAQLFQNVVQLEPAYHLSVGHEDIDRAMNFCRIFTVMAESFLEKMVNEDLDKQPHYAIKSFDLVLNCVGHYDYEVAEITFNLWYRLSEDLYQKNDDALTIHFRPYIERLLTALYRLSQMEPDHEGLLDEGDSFMDFRRKVSDIIKDVVFIVGSSNCFKQMFMILQEPNATWESSEAALFVMENVAKNILPDENDVVPKVAEAILNLTESNTHIAFRYTSIMLLGELSEWIDNHPESLEAVLNFLLYSLNQKNGLAAAAATALTQICTACKSRMTCHLNGLLQIAANLDSYQITNESAINLLKGISIIVGRLPLDQLAQPLQELCSFQIVPLRALVEANVKVDRHQRSDPSYWLDRIAAIVRYTDPDVRESETHPCFAVLCEVWPIISQIFGKYQTDSRIMERSCRCIRYAMRSIGKQAAPLLEPLVKQIVELYATHHHSCFLYLGSILVDEFANVSDQCTQGLLDMMQAFIQPTFTRLQAENGLKNNPDTVDDFFRLCSRFLQRCPLPFLQSAIVTPILQCALLACTLDHKDANLSVMKFFYSLLNCGRPQQHHHHHHHQNNTNNVENVAQQAANTQKQHLVHQIVQANGDALVMNLIHASVYYLHSYMMSDVADVLVELKQIDAQLLDANLRRALEALPKKNSGGCITATSAQLDEFHNAVLRSETTKAVSHALKDFTRLYR